MNYYYYYYFMFKILDVTQLDNGDDVVIRRSYIMTYIPFFYSYLICLEMYSAKNCLSGLDLQGSFSFLSRL